MCLDALPHPQIHTQHNFSNFLTTLSSWVNMVEKKHINLSHKEAGNLVSEKEGRGKS